LWRAVRRLGAIQIGDGIVALPSSPRNLEHLEWLAAGIRDDSGSATVWAATPTSSRANKAFVAASRAAVEDEYGELIAEARAAAITPGESGERRRMLQRLRRRLRQVASRDYFGAPSATSARAAIDRLARTEAGVQG